MATLHTVIEKTKIILKALGAIVAVVIVVLLIYRIGLFVRDRFFPEPPPPPTVTFGKLTAPVFPESVSSDLTYEIDTLTGKLPVITGENDLPLDRVTVYKIHNPVFSLLDLQNTKATVAKIGFLGKESPTGDPNVYLWTMASGGLQREILMNIVSKNFDYASSFRLSGRILSRLNMPDSAAAVTKSKEFLNTMNLYPKDIDENKTETELLRIEGTELIPVETLREAQVIRVNFFQKDFGGLPIFYDNPPFSTLNFYVSGGERFDPEVVEGNFKHQLFTDESATYPIKPVESAYEELKAGKGYVGANFSDSQTIKIKEVLLGYYASSQFQNYLIPIYVFKSTADEFYAYVPAIPDIWFTDPDSAVLTPGD